MVTKQNTPKPLKKSNSPVSKTGQGVTVKKRLLRAKEEDLAKGRERILLAARACFSRTGFAGTSMKDIQIAADCSRGNLYHHFKTKSEIVQTIINQNLARYSERIEAILLESPGSDLSLSDVIQDLASFAEEITKGPGKGMAFHVWSLAMIDPDTRSTMVQFFERIRSALEKKILVLQSNGKIPSTRDTQNLSVTLFGLLIPGFTLQSVFMDDKSLNSVQYSEALNLLFKGH
jgi:TetR/AcrR family transcriptional repressor of uid operon